MPVINNFADLKQVSKALKEEAKAREEAEKKRRAEEARRHAEANQFAAAMAEFGVRKMSQKKLADTKAPKPRPVALNLGTGEDKEPESQMSDLLDASVFLETEDGRMMHRKGVSPDIPRKLYRGEWPVEAAIDLHGMRVDEAREAVARFILENHMSGRRCLRIVHGVGYGSKGQGVLRDMVRRWLKQRPEVMAFVQCPPNDGDEGAVRVLVTQQKRDCGRTRDLLAIKAEGTGSCLSPLPFNFILQASKARTRDACQTASSPISPVRMRIACSTS